MDPARVSAVPGQTVPHLSNLLPVASPCPGTNFLILSYLWSSIPAVFLPASSAIPRSRVGSPNCWGWPAALMSGFKPGRHLGANSQFVVNSGKSWRTSSALGQVAGSVTSKESDEKQHSR